MKSMTTDFLITAIISLFILIFGASIGSFLNVVVYRLPAGLSLIKPPSRCPHCFHPLGKTENIPIFGWLWLGGRCRWCRTPIAIRYPLVETATGLLFCCIFWQFGLTLTTLGYWLLSSWLIALSLIDLDTLTLPGVLMKSGLILGIIFQGLKGWQSAQLPTSLILAIGSATLGLWLFDLIRWLGTLSFNQMAMGDGDPPLAAMIGAWLGWQFLLLTGFLACLLGAIFGGLAIISGLTKRQQPIPFGPFLALGAVSSIFWGNSIITTYLKLFFPLT